MSRLSDLGRAIESREAVIGVVGLGYVGLPLLRAFFQAGFPVLGYDVDDEKVQMLRRGDSYRVPDQSGLTMLTGNAGGLQIEVDGQQAPAVGAVGAIVRNISLDPQRLQSGTAVNR